MKRKKDILLDFTSLLDVTMIILFFFLLFSRMDVEKAEAELSSVMDEYHSMEADLMETEQELQAQIDGLSSWADELAGREDELAFQQQLLAEQDAQAAANLEALSDFSKSKNLKIRIEHDDADWIVKIERGDEEATIMDSGMVNGEQFGNKLKSLGFEPTDTILCIFVYEGNLPGSRSAYNTVSDALRVLKGEYTHLYISEMDVS